RRRPHAWQQLAGADHGMEAVAEGNFDMADERILQLRADGEDRGNAGALHGQRERWWVRALAGQKNDALHGCRGVGLDDRTVLDSETRRVERLADLRLVAEVAHA